MGTSWSVSRHDSEPRCTAKPPCSRWRTDLVAKKNGVRPEQSELSEGVGGTFGRLTLFDTATSHELLNGTHPKRTQFQRRSGNETQCKLV